MKIVIVDGRLGRDAELKTTEGGTKYVRFTLANSTFERGETKTEWFDVTAYDEFVLEKQIKVLKKGAYVIVTGNFKTDVNVEGGKLYLNQRLTAIKIDVPSIGGKKENSDSDEETVSTYTEEPAQEEKTTPVKDEEVAKTVVSTETEDDDLPF